VLSIHKPLGSTPRREEQKGGREGGRKKARKEFIHSTESVSGKDLSAVLDTDFKGLKEVKEDKLGK
jgi:hypothetical protein